ncbi:dihydroorotase [Coralliovum pocilloporae]|uniref:dihydroorotase n=1 Tax=Coralliovum pocilloporae TaxID=3066369 RepID=UPI003306B83F
MADERRKGNTVPVILKNARLYDPSQPMDEHGSLLIEDGIIKAQGGPDELAPSGTEIIDCEGHTVMPGLVDARVFVGEPGAEHRETLRSASKAAAAGGVTTIVVMPDTDPVIDDIALLDFIMRRGRDESVVRVRAMAAMTQGLEGREITEFGLLKETGALGFTDGRHSISNAMLMARALTYARDFKMPICHHTQDLSLSSNGVMNAGENASRLGLPGIPHEAETIVVDRDIRLARMTRGYYHAASISSPESARLIAGAKLEGLNVTAGISVNHLTLNENDIGSYRTFFKMSPPLRSEEDRQQMIEALKNGTIDIIQSSHDPQDVETKRHPFAEAEDGAIGLETLLSAALRLVHSGDVPLATVIKAMTSNPARLLNLEGGTLKSGSPADIVVADLDRPWVVKADALKSRSKNTPFEDARMQGKVLRTIVAGNTVYTYQEA